MELRHLLGILMCVQNNTGLGNSITKLIKSYSRPITIFVVGFDNVENSYFHDFYNLNLFKNHVFILFSETVKDYSFSGKTNVIALSRPINTSIVTRLSEVENFDITIVHNADQFCSSLGAQSVDALLNMGPTILFCFSHYSLRDHFIDYLASSSLKNNIDLIEDTHKNKYYLLAHITKQQYIQRQHWLEIKKPGLDNSHVIQSELHLKQLIKTIRTGMIIKTDWMPGINLISFKMCNGIWPSSSFLNKYVMNDLRVPHPDWSPNNMIVQGEKMALIDFYHDTIVPKKTENQFFLSRLSHWLLLKNWKEVKDFFWKKLLPSPGKIQAMNNGLF